MDISEPVVVGRLLDVHGEDLVTIYDRAVLDGFGFQRSDDG